jgi:spore germination cell wall hydrolase CwlJ-like protein
MGSGIGMALGAIYLSAGMAQAISDHHRAVRIAQAAGGALSETMLQREMDRLDPAALRLARAHDQFAADDPREGDREGGKDWGQGWPSAMGERAAVGHRASPLESARQLDCLTQAVYFEARGEIPRGQAAVAQVVMNRVANPSFPKTVCGVVFQGAAQSALGHGCQFSFACDGSMRHGLEAEAWDRARQVAERALSGAVLADIGSATHFHTTSVRPDWGPQMLRVAQVGLHVFYRFNPHAPLGGAMAPAAERAVFVSLPAQASPAPVLQKAVSVTVSAPTGVAADTSAKVMAAKPGEASKAAETAAAAQAADAAS